MADLTPIAVVEMPRFASSTRKMLDDEQRQDLTDFLAYNPEAGEVIAGTGGVRKVRWALPGRGKSGGARVIYYYHDERIPLFLLEAYAKNEKEDLTFAERNAYRQLVAAITANLKEREK